MYGEFDGGVEWTYEEKNDKLSFMKKHVGERRKDIMNLII